MCSIVNVALNPLDTVHFRTWRDENIRQSARGSGRRYPALVPSEQGRTSKRMSGSGVYSRKSVGWLWFCMFLVSTGFLHQQTMGATEVECLMHEDCKPGQFCAYVPNIDSYEGWRFAISTCKACSQCVCHFSSTTNRCPQERLVFSHRSPGFSVFHADEKKQIPIHSYKIPIMVSHWLMDCTDYLT